MKYFLKHPLKVLKPYLPKSMFGRSLLILVLPLILIETTAVYIFLDSHWDRVTKTIAKNIAGDVGIITALHNNAPKQQAFYQSLAGTYLKFRIEFVPHETVLPSVPESLKDTPLDIALKEQIFGPYTFTIQQREIFIETAVKDGILKFETPLSRFCSRGAFLFVAWVAFTSAVFLFIAVVFLHNQIKPLRRLAIAADRFGKGRSFPPLKPEGSIEIRKLTHAFIEMRERLQRQLTQRATMLAGVSHDLRTPLTRMRLQLTMMPLSQEIVGLQKDVEEMSKMLEGYLTFARGEGPEEASEIDINSLLLDAIEGRADPRVPVHYSPTNLPLFNVKPQALKRCLMNLINNATRYGKQVWIGSHTDNDSLFISIEDDGPGIPEGKREEVFKPFFRLDSSRNIATGGVGLGLSIARDIAHGHGGEISLSASEHGGLKALVMIPY
jgi:two-component system osmolarity sensor histidine kinase EnvZ